MNKKQGNLLDASGNDAPDLTSKEMSAKLSAAPVRRRIELYWSEKGGVSVRNHLLPHDPDATHRITFYLSDGHPDINSIKMEKIK